MKIVVICERPDGWTWRIEHQEGCESGVDIVYQEDEQKESTRTCIGGLDDAKALANALLAYVHFMEQHHES